LDGKMKKREEEGENVIEWKEGDRGFLDEPLNHGIYGSEEGHSPGS
jgi:hypothetical protein